ncbi:MAG TPA: hypothetical protein PKD26_14030 [Pyrinomonadaceae bacterium]|nr:hypothetical protein [Pyrinomonadaceae bacterium]
MKKLLSMGLIGFTIAIAAPVAEARTTTTGTSVSEQYQWEQPQRNRRANDRRWNRGRTHSYVTTRIVRSWGRTYRETIRVTRLPNGRVQTRVLHRVRIR